MTQWRASGPDAQQTITTPEQLVDYFRAGEKPASRWRVGTEHEKVGLYQEGLRPVPHEGERGIGVLLNRIASADDWEPILEDDQVIALQKDAASLTLEPGGQLELSGAPLDTIHQTCREFHQHLSLMKRISEPLGIVWLGLGLHPIHGISEVSWMPKGRYRIMREYLPTRGELGLEMMQLSAGVQANFDYSDEQDMVRKLRATMSLTPIVSSIFANSSLYLGKTSGFISRRMHVWQHTDPDRTGILDFVFDADFGYQRYADWALDVPVFFILRDDEYLPLRGKTFRQFLAEGHQGHQATLADFDLHLTTLFPEARLKKVIEVRGADSVPPGLTCSLPAIWKGVLYDSEALDAAAQLVSGWSREDRQASLDAVARRGLEAEAAGRPLLEWARELVAIAGEGLRRQDQRNASGEDERIFLDPILEQLELGVSPGQLVAQRWESEWQRSPERLIEYARY